MPQPAPAPVKLTDRRLQIIIWAAILGSIVMYYVVMRMVKPPSPLNDVTVALVLSVSSLVLVGSSFLLKRRLAAPGGFIVALALCDAGAVLGLASWFITGSPLAGYPLIFGFAGALLHFPMPPESPE